WPLCPADFSIPERPPFGPHLGDDDTELTSDEADMIDGQVSDFRGNVTLSTKTDAAAADHMRYFEQEERVELKGNVKLWDAQTYLNSETADIKLATDENWFYDASYMMRETRGRGDADEIYHKPDIVTRLKRADYTTCSPTAEFWKISARELDLDYVTGRGVAKHAVLRIKNVPVFYTPYASFPIDDRRKSGFLHPSAGISSRNGFETQTPYYWNIAPQMDATFTPRVMADRGVMLMGEYRYLFEQGDGQLDLEYLPSDSKSSRDYRGAVSYVHDQRYLDNRGRLSIDYNWVSDIDYFQDFGNSLAISGTRFVRQQAQTQYNGSWWRLFARVQNFQTVDSTIPGRFSPYKRLPQIRFDSRLAEYNNQFNFRFQSEAVYFTREDT
ncbi:MAG: LPS assembly protein LptD, partial [Gammaproteobacteria bacterium]